MTIETPDPMLVMVYETAYDYLTKHPEFDGRPHPDHPGVLRRGMRPEAVQPWPGVADVPRMTRDEWVRARLEAIASGDESPALRPRPRTTD